MLAMLLPHQLVLQLGHLQVHVVDLLLVLLLRCKEVHPALALFRFLNKLLEESRIEVLSVVEIICVLDRVDLWLLLRLWRHVHRMKQFIVGINLREHEFKPP